MKRKKISTRGNNEFILFDNKIVKISKDENSNLIFETSNEITTDIAEGVAIVMRLEKSDSKVWDIDTPKSYNDIRPEKCLYWLSGGNKEWNTLENYTKPWSEVYIHYKQEYGVIIVDIINSSHKLSDIKNQFIKKLNLPSLYEFALSLDIVK